MKKKILFSAFSLASLVGYALACLIPNANSASPVLAEEVSSTEAITVPSDAKKYIGIEELITSLPAGYAYRETDALYWGAYTYGNLDKIYDAVDCADGVDSSVYTDSWNQYTQYVMFQWGAANDAHDVGIRVHYYDISTNEEIKLAGSETAYIETIKNNTFSGNGMVLRYFKISDDIWNAYKSTGFKMSFELFDNVTGNGGYAYHLFGYFHANQTFDEIRVTLNNHYFYTLPGDSRNYQNKDEFPDMKATIRGHYLANSLLAEALNAPVANMDEDFETLEHFNNHWFYDQGYENRHGHGATPHFDKVIGTDNYRPHDNYLPFNKEGNGFFRGWYEESLNSGFVGCDEFVYRFISAPYVLPEGEAFVSIKMAGTASLHILDGDSHAELAFIDNRVHKYDLDQFVYQGFNTCTMARHVINLSQFAGQKVRFCIADIRNSGWGAVYFDDFKCNVNPNDGFRVDEVVQTLPNETTYYSTFQDIYISSANNGNDNNNYAIDYKDDNINPTDNSAMKAAHEFITSYTNTNRQGQGLDICDSLTSATLKEFITSYNELSEDAQKIVCASDDYEQDFADAGKEHWYFTPVVITNLGHNLSYIAIENGMSATIYTAQSSYGIGVLNSQSIYVIFPIVIISFSALALGALLIVKKRKKFNK